MSKTQQLLVLLVISTIFTGCTIEEFPGREAPNGSVHVTAYEMGTDNEVSGGVILLDGVERGERTPAYLHGIAPGSHEIVVKLFGYWNDTTAVAIAAGDTVGVQSELETVPADQNGWIAFDSNISGARLLIDGKTFEIDEVEVRSPSVIPIQWGTYSVSAHKEGHATVDPILPTVTVAAAETSLVDFTLEAGTVARQVDMLPIDFTLENVYGDSIRLTDLTGHVVLLNFWYVACQPCISEFPYIDEVYRHHVDQDFRVIAVSDRDSKESMISTAEGLELTFPLLRDVGGAYTRFQYVVTAFPTNIMIDRTGKIRSIVNVVDEATFEDEVVSLLEEDGQ